MKIACYIGLIVGLAIFAALLAWQGIAEIAGMLVASGWALLLVPLVWLPAVFMNTRCWQMLFLPEHAPGFWQAFYAQWMGRSVNTLLPVASIGGEVVKARALILWGANARHVGASVVVDKTVQVIVLILWGLAGISLLAWMALDDTLAVAALIGLSVLAAGVAGFLILQHAGMFGFIVKSAHKVTKGDFFANMAPAAGEVDRLVVDLYRRRGRLFVATVWRGAALVLQTGEVWLAAWLLGHPIGLLEAMMLKSLSSSLSDAAFVVPNSYGIQEGAFIVLGGLVGLAPDASLAISLAIRIREVFFDIPGLLFWQHTEGRALLRRRQAGSRTAD